MSTGILRDLESMVKATGFAVCDTGDGTGEELSAAIDTNFATEILLHSVLHDKGVAGTLDTKATESDTSGGSYTDVASGAIAQQIANGVASLAIKPSKRYLKVSCTAGTNAITGFGFVEIAGSKTYPNPL